MSNLYSVEEILDEVIDVISMYGPTSLYSLHDGTILKFPVATLGEVRDAVQLGVKRKELELTPDGKVDIRE